MTDKAGFALRGGNPDVLTCIANLSNDEVFTPPEFAAQMLDTLAEAWAIATDGEDIWANSDVTFLDPFTKSGVFLREITARLTAGLADKIPDLQERVEHILTKQIYGIAITGLTSLLARRSVYCSKDAAGEHSIVKSLNGETGNIWFEPLEHTWVQNKCKFCGASKTTLDRGAGFETHAYAFIHSDDITARLAELFGEEMQFDVIIGNPPYQLQSDGGTRDMPIYQHFVRQAKQLGPRFLSMVVPSRWMAGGLGLNDFRAEMLGDRRLAALFDYPVSREVFPGVEVKGGISYFLWDADHDGQCAVTTVRGEVGFGPTQRTLDEFDIFVRESRAISILRKVLVHKEASITSILSVDKEFGWTSNFDGFHATERPKDIPVYYVRKGRRGVGFIERSNIAKSPELIDTWKVLIPKAGSDGGQKIPDLVLGKPWIAPAPSATTQSFLFFHLATEKEARRLQDYLRTRFFRFLVSLRKLTQDATRSTYMWVPVQDFTQDWTDEILREKYGITDSEWAFIEEMIRPMTATEKVAGE